MSKVLSRAQIIEAVAENTYAVGTTGHGLAVLRWTELRSMSRGDVLCLVAWLATIEQLELDEINTAIAAVQGAE